MDNDEYESPFTAVSLPRTPRRSEGLAVAAAFVVLVGGVAFAPARAAQAGEPAQLPPGGMTVRLGGPVHLAASERVEVLAVIGGDARVEGTVTDALIVVSGQGTVEGTVLGNVVVVGGGLTVGPTARVLGDVSLVGSRLDQRPGAVVRGTVTRSEGSWPSWRFRFLLWLAMGLTVTAGAFLFYTFGRRSLEETAELLVGAPVDSVLASVALWVGAPLLALLAMLTAVGIPAALGLLFFVLPLLWLLGYLVAGAVVGAGLARAFGRAGRPWSLGSRLAAGLVNLQLAALLPFIGPPLIIVAGHLGAGAFVYGVWRRRRPQHPAALASEPSRAPSPSTAQAAHTPTRVST
jgi:hypothetical protein